MQARSEKQWVQEGKGKALRKNEFASARKGIQEEQRDYARQYVTTQNEAMQGKEYRENMVTKYRERFTKKGRQG